MKQPNSSFPLFTNWQFQRPFRTYQQMVLQLVGQRAKSEAPFHIVAPPGAGKTIVGLEMIRQFGRPAVVFTPTTTIQQQWQEKIGLFTQDVTWLAQHTSTDATRLADVTILTYQVLSTPGENLAFVERIAVEKWVEDLVTSGQVNNHEEAHRRITTLQQSNPKAARNEISKRYQRVKRNFLRQKAFDGRQFLHPNAQNLIDRIVAMGTGTVVLDECHHLLDYWAFILQELIRELPNVQVVGLTATLPDPANETEYENYHALLGEVDFEVPTPAVVKEGNLAPYRDLVYFCEPSPREADYLTQIQTHFETAVSTIATTSSFQTWIEQLLAQGAEPFETFFNRETPLCIAAVKYALTQERPLPDDAVLLEEMLQPLEVDDWLTLLETFGLRVLKISPDEADQTLFRQLRDVLLNFGITISERGINHQRSPGDLILALSESKDQATVNILKAEAAHLQKKLRAVVITDFERMSASSRRLKAVLDPDAGSAVRVFRQLVNDPVTNLLDPVLVTGQVVLANAANRARLDVGIEQWQKAKNRVFTWEWQPAEDGKIVQLVGNGRDWGARSYVALLTSLFEQGVTQCLVGTRGIFGEGWDALSLNTLVDLTSVTTSTSVQQIRGRTIRLDPAWSRKVAHNWDVVCVTTQFDKGDNDLRRFTARHAHTWGIVIRSLLSPYHGQIIRGVAHVDLDLAEELATRPFSQLSFSRYTQQMMAAIPQRDRVYDLWQIGKPYHNNTHSSVQVRAQDIQFLTVYHIQTSLWAMIGRLLVSVILVALFAWQGGGQILAQAELSGLSFRLGVVAVIGLGVLAAVLFNLVSIGRIFRRAFLQMPVDDILSDIAYTLWLALKETGLISQDVKQSDIQIVPAETEGYQLFLESATTADAQTFALAFREILGPIGDARYLIERDSSSLRNPVFRAIWLGMRAILKGQEATRVYHRVPDVFASRKERATKLSRAWSYYVGGGRLIFTRTAEGRRLLLQARGQQKQKVQQMAFEVWK